MVTAPALQRFDPEAAEEDKLVALGSFVGGRDNASGNRFCVGNVGGAGNSQPCRPDIPDTELLQQAAKAVRQCTLTYCDEVTIDPGIPASAIETVFRSWETSGVKVPQRRYSPGAEIPDTDRSMRYINLWYTSNCYQNSFCLFW